MVTIGIDLGGTKIAAGIVDEAYRIVRKGSVPTLADRDPELIVKDMGALCLSLLEQEGIPLSEVKGVGIASPGSVNPDTGVIGYANNLPFRRFDIAARLRKYLPVEKIALENDANAAALGEAMSGAAKGEKISVMITLGTGVGGGVILDGQVYSGFNHAGAELGHVVIEYNGRPCSCGRRGCWEAYSSATALVKMTKEALDETKNTVMWQMCEGDREKANARTAFDAMRQGDRVGREVVDKYIDYLACGITNMINIFQPNVLSIGGGISNERDYLLKPLIEKIEKEQYTSSLEEKTKVKIAELGNDAGLIGAAALVR